MPSATSNNTARWKRLMTLPGHDGHRAQGDKRNHAETRQYST